MRHRYRDITNRLLTAAVILTSTILLCGCSGRSQSALLDRADSLLATHPDSALRILHAIDRSRLGHGAVAARYAILSSYARYSTGHDDVYDPDVEEALKYYVGRDSDPRLLGTAYFLSGRHKLNDGREFQAVTDLLSAEKYSMLSGDTILIYDVYKGLGDAFNLLGDHSGSSSYYNNGFSLVSNYDEERTEEMRLLSGVQHILLGQDYLGKEQLKMVADYAESHHNDALLSEARSLMVKYSDENRLTGHKDEYDPDANNHDNQIRFLYEYYQQQEDTHRLEGEKRTLVFTIILVSVALVAILVVILLRQRISEMRRDNREKIEALRELHDSLESERLTMASVRKRLEENERELTSMKENLPKSPDPQASNPTADDKDLSELRRRVAVLMKYQFRSIRQLTEAYYSNPGSVRTERDKIEKVIDSVKNNEDLHLSMELLADEESGGMMSAFRKDFPNLQEREYLLFLYLMMDFSPRAISIFQDVKIENVYNRKSSLKRKISSSSCKNKEDYLRMMG